VEAAPTKPEAASAGQLGAEQQADIVLGLIVAPGLARDVTAKVASELAHDLEALDLGVEWRTELTVNRLVAPPAQTTEIIDAARRKLLDANWISTSSSPSFPCGSAAAPSHGRSARRTESPSSHFPRSARCTSRRDCGGHSSSSSTSCSDYSVSARWASHRGRARRLTAWGHSQRSRNRSGDIPER
jgi:hypothetical protein